MAATAGDIQSSTQEPVDVAIEIHYKDQPESEEKEPNDPFKVTVTLSDEYNRNIINGILFLILSHSTFSLSICSCDVCNVYNIHNIYSISPVQIQSGPGGDGFAQTMGIHCI